MKILFLINSLKNKSGSERVACILANKLVENLDYEITIINRDANSKEVAYYLNKKIHVKEFLDPIFSFTKDLVIILIKSNQIRL